MSDSTLNANQPTDRLAHWAGAHTMLLNLSVFLEITVIIFISTVPTQLFFKPTSDQRTKATLYTKLHHLDRSSPKHLVLHKPGVIAPMTSELYHNLSTLAMIYKHAKCSLHSLSYNLRHNTSFLNFFNVFFIRKTYITHL